MRSLLALVATLLATMALAQVPEACFALSEHITFKFPLLMTGHAIDEERPLKIAAIGSSSTFGTGASSSERSYPARLLLALDGLDIPIKVFNRGHGGEEEGDELERFQHDVIDLHPALVIWQVGTNAVMRDHNIDEVMREIREGVMRLKHSGADVILIDPQYAPRYNEKRSAKEMVKRIEVLADELKVNLFRRYALMEYWSRDTPTEGMISPDGLHMNDWSYDCMAKVLAHTIVSTATR